MPNFSHFKLNLLLVFFLVLILPVVFLQSQKPQSILNYAKETSVSGTSAQLSVVPTSVPVQNQINITKNFVETANTVNIATHSFIYDIFLIIIFGVVFVFLFYVLVKKFL